MSLGDFVTLQRGHDLPEPQRRVGKVPVMGSFGLTGFHDTPKAQGPGVTIGRSGASIGVISFVRKDYWPLNTVLYVTNFRGNNPLFTYYFLKSLDLIPFDSGSAQPSLNRNYIYPIKIEVPRRNEQDAIASILGALDDKIELNRRMNETLEALARAIFKSWFVDFDPVRAKAEGGTPVGMDAATSAIFPNRFSVDGLPDGWQRAFLEDLTEVLGRGIAPSYIESGGVAVINQRCVRNLRLDLSKARRHDPARRSIAGREVKVGDILVNSTGQGTLGRVAYVLDLPEPANSRRPRYHRTRRCVACSKFLSRTQPHRSRG
jgi:type I restriction enzyme, S subunit